MIGLLKGIILEKNPYQILLETHGIGYEVQLPMTCFSTIPEIGKEVIIFTHLIVKKDTHILFGFTNKKELILFRELIKVNGIGPKLALAILSRMSAEQFMSAIKNKDINNLIKLPSVGKKTAERLIIEMKNKFNSVSNNIFLKEIIESTKQNTNPHTEAVAALIKLGYKLKEARKMINNVEKKSDNCEILIRDALRTIR